MGDADEGFETACGLLAAGDVPGLMRHLRTGGGTLPLDAVAALTADAARLSGCGDLERAAAAALEGGPCNAQALYDFGHACLGRGLAFLAVRPLERPSRWTRRTRRCSPSSSAPSKRTGSTRAPWRCWRSTSP